MRDEEGIEVLDFDLVEKPHTLAYARVRVGGCIFHGMRVQVGEQPGNVFVQPPLIYWKNKAGNVRRMPAVSFPKPLWKAVQGAILEAWLKSYPNWRASDGLLYKEKDHA